jgi:two-component system, OmpR family, response regulator BaeR
VSPGPVLIVEDEAKIAQVLSDYLVAAGFEVEVLARGDGVSAWVQAHSPQLVLLDLMVPGMPGLDVCRALRRFSSVPIIVVTAMVEELDRLLGLELGADDYICKPFSPREVVARVKAVLRRPLLALATDEGVQSIGPFSLDEPRRRIMLNGDALKLTLSEFKLLRRLLQHPGRVFSRTQLLIELHGTDDNAFDRAIDTHIKNLRKSLGVSAPLLRTVYGVGYQIELQGP